ncbi:hypothetical protein TREMEDRAFT_56186 [Tremella mesenterica DSM 1558]|uniref:uncharacterized protein n=1 Tax=Tremella mesenterica (strain ATCC 24925 / CBS 8224 / DSM 1558 / NBRC 9311 / NRRL Y-6157 / RJB 2259-6 / UBC 559-6) TaxID=578456 RepID=UPI0003F49C70|nr:uncharacterized protein TREMEDRAFT_56186 [Tremella mesenterica DSM 1558]EIW73351.1 hypothetical protein TREMEDRAFT_56186 [Tremella mesenterica DSM 1558]
MLPLYDRVLGLTLMITSFLPSLSGMRGLNSPTVFKLAGSIDLSCVKLPTIPFRNADALATVLTLSGLVSPPASSG